MRRWWNVPVPIPIPMKTFLLNFIRKLFGQLKEKEGIGGPSKLVISGIATS